MNKKSKEKILNLMKKDVKNEIKNITEDELNHFCNNLFILCYLKTQKIDRNYIANQIMNNNNLFLHDMEQKKQKLPTENFKIKIGLYTKLQNKYINIIKMKI